MNVQQRSLGTARIALIAVLGVGAFLVSAWADEPDEADTASKSIDAVVYKTPTCGCCNDWITHLRNNGFDVDVVNVPNTQPIHARYGVPRVLGSCHTAVIGEQWVEGHVPADLIHKMIEQPNDIRGIAVPGMPMGSPGMEGPNPVEYNIVASHADGRKSLFARRQGRSTRP